MPCTMPNNKASTSVRTQVTGRRLSAAATAIETAIAGSTQRGEVWVEPKVASISVSEWPTVNAVTVRSKDHQTALPG
jgi:hypothetical protein